MLWDGWLGFGRSVGVGLRRVWVVGLLVGREVGSGVVGMVVRAARPVEGLLGAPVGILLAQRG